MRGVTESGGRGKIGWWLSQHAAQGSISLSFPLLSLVCVSRPVLEQCTFFEVDVAVVPPFYGDQVPSENAALQVGCLFT